MGYRDLEVWKKSFHLAREVILMTSNIPVTERYGLTDQIKRSAISIPSNIAEGHARGTTREFIRFLFIASGSAAELETQLMLVKELKWAAGIDQLLSEVSSIRMMLSKLISSLRRKLN